MIEPEPLFIDGKWIAGGDREICYTTDPARETVVTAMTSATPEDTDSAANAAFATLPEWSSITGSMRAEIMRDISVAVKEKREQLASRITAEMGKPLQEARTEVEGVASIFSFFADCAENTDSLRDTLENGTERVAAYQAVGPVLAINTWNFPVETVATPLAPALAAGCTGIVLANPVAPSSVVSLFEIFESCGLPPGSVNLIAGDGPVISRALIADSRVAHVAYTGSVNVGRVLAEQAGRMLKRATLELGGNAPAIVLPGADVEKAATSFMAKRFWNAGQVCTAPNRIYVHSSIYDAFQHYSVAYCESLRVGPGDEPNTTMGPVATQARAQAMSRFIDDAIEKGARTIYCGEIPDGAGYFIKPTVFADVPDNAFAVREEVFGPVACVSRFDDTTEVLARANDCDLGLSAYVYGPDSPSTREFAAKIQAGSVGVNQMTTAFIDTAFGGIKQSGLGAIGGKQALNEFQKVRLTAIGK